MIHKIFYGAAPKFTEADCRDFSRGNYECKALMRDHRGAPVVISRSIDPAFRGWRVAYGMSSVFFNTYDEAMAFCKGRFSR